MRLIKLLSFRKCLVLYNNQITICLVVPLAALPVFFGRFVLFLAEPYILRICTSAHRFYLCG